MPVIQLNHSLIAKKKQRNSNNRAGAKQVGKKLNKGPNEKTIFENLF